MYKSLLIIALILSSSFLVSNETSQKEYFEIIEQYPSLISPKGDASKGEIEILLDKEKIAAIEKATGRDVGVMKRDKYFLWVNDACLFPNGKEGVYGRILWNTALKSTPAIAIMPILPDGRIVLNCNYRHATRAWEIELARGLVDPLETPELAAQREAKEETGMVVDKVWLLGSMPPDNGVASLVVPVFAAKVLSTEERKPEDSEAIEEILALTLEEIQKGFKKGFYTLSIRGEGKEVFFRDPFLAYALSIYSQSSP